MPRLGARPESTKVVACPGLGGSCGAPDASEVAVLLALLDDLGTSELTFG